MESSKNTVKIGVRAPKGVHIYREEIYNEIKKSNKQAHYFDVEAIGNIKSAQQDGASFDLIKKIKKNDLPN